MSMMAFTNHQPYDCLLNRLFRCRSKKTSELCVTGLCEGNSPVTGEFPEERASNTENVSIWWRHHDKLRLHCMTGPCITNVFATRRKNFSQWYRSFQRKLLSHWLKFLRHVAKIISGATNDNTAGAPHLDFNISRHLNKDLAILWSVEIGF